ncbi:MAG: hypothetical protein HYX47_11395 [Burkholderiales bacterium]|nr:hypothetical protein [Burkholderiales bacterium]
MTAEVLIMNKGGVALAADSAVTIGSSKVYNSANKLFALSKLHPVGVMIYGNAELMGLPWETLIKEYRQSVLGAKSFPTLQEYATDFVQFLKSTAFILPEYEATYLRDLFRFQIQKVKEGMVSALQALVKTQGAFTAAEASTALENAISARLSTIAKQPFLKGGSQTKATGVVAKNKTIFDDALKTVLEKVPITGTQKTALKKLCGMSLYKKAFFGSSGVVIAGFGDNQILPEFVSLQIEGRVDGFFKHWTVQVGAVTPTSSAWIVPFAQQEMVSTFMNGRHPEMDQVIFGTLGNIFEGLPAILIPTATAQKKTALKAKLGTLLTDFKTQIDQYAKQNFVMKILNSVQALPKDELASMAEALVNLTSFKRRVTLDTETVGGPIDVAVISKGDGFVWIQRKHYFEPKLNQMYLTNYQRGLA